MHDKNALSLDAAILLLVCVGGLLLLSCKKQPALPRPVSDTPPESPSNEPEITPAQTTESAKTEPPAWPHPRSDEREDDRRRMAGVIERVYGLKDKQALAAIRNVPRHWFVPDHLQAQAYFDGPLPIGQGQTISQPYIVAYMTSLLGLDESKSVLEIGTGSGYQAAVLSELTPHVYSIEILEALGKAAQKKLKDLGYSTVQVKIGDGYKGWPEHAPFDAIIVTCAPDHIPPDLIEQLKTGGKMVIPVGGVFRVQDLILVTKDAEGEIHKESKMPVRFVPLTREKSP